MSTLAKRPETRVQKSDCSVECGCSVVASLPCWKLWRRTLIRKWGNPLQITKPTRWVWGKQRALGKMLDAQKASNVEMEKDLEDQKQKMQDTRGTRMKDQWFVRGSSFGGDPAEDFQHAGHSPRSALPALCWQAFGRWLGSDYNFAKICAQRCIAWFLCGARAVLVSMRSAWASLQVVCCGAMQNCVFLLRVTWCCVFDIAQCCMQAWGWHSCCFHFMQCSVLNARVSYMFSVLVFVCSSVVLQVGGCMWLCPNVTVPSLEISSCWLLWGEHL